MSKLSAKSVKDILNEFVSIPALDKATSKSSMFLEVAAIKELTEAISVLLNTLEIHAILSPCVIVASCPLISSKISFKGLIAPVASSNTFTVSSIAAAASVDGAVKDKIIFLSLIPPSSAFIPTLANKPSAVFISVMPPLRKVAVLPTFKIAFPNISTVVLLF